MYDERFNDAPDPPVRIAVVLCTETDDLAAPEGVYLPSGARYRFSGLLASMECPPGVDVGTVYLVYVNGPRRGLVVAEMIDQDYEGAEEQRRLMCRYARQTGVHAFQTYYGRLSCPHCGLTKKA